MAIIPVLKWEPAPNVLAWKYPSTELSTWSQLIVAESQEAVLVKEGQFVGPFAAGRHVLSTENYPILSSLLKIPFGRSPFTAEVWFIQRAFSLDVRWGTGDPIQVEDPQYHIMLGVRAFGQYGIQITDSRMFLQKLVGTLPVFTTSTLTTFFKGIILTLVKSYIAKQLVREQIPLLQISAYLEEISEKLQEALINKLATYGVRLVNFSVNSINVDENDPAVTRLRSAMAERAEMQIVGYSYQQKRSFDVMETAAGNEGSGGMQSGLMGAGIGLGMGATLGQNMGRTMNTQLNTDDVRCPACGQMNSTGAKFCCNCGQSLAPAQPTMRHCTECGQTISSSDKFCPHCGHKN